MVTGRLVTGLGIGASAIVVPAYLGELAPARHRGAVVQVYEVRGGGHRGAVVLVYEVRGGGGSAGL